MLSLMKILERTWQTSLRHLRIGYPNTRLNVTRSEIGAVGDEAFPPSDRSVLREGMSLFLTRGGKLNPKLRRMQIEAKMRKAVDAATSRSIRAWYAVGFLMPDLSTDENLLVVSNAANSLGKLLIIPSEIILGQKLIRFCFSSRNRLGLEKVCFVCLPVPILVY